MQNGVCKLCWSFVFSFHFAAAISNPMLVSFSIATISDNNIGQWLPFPPYPLPNVVLQVQKKNRKKSRHHCSNIERGEAGQGFRLRVARDFWLGLYSLYMLGISMGLFQACHVIDFQKRHNIKQPNVNKPELPLEIISKEIGQNNIVPKFGKERKSYAS